jgi:hypothetical protein
MFQQVKLSERGKLSDQATPSAGNTRTGTTRPSGVAEEVFRRVSELGGLLVVALVAPVPAGGQGSGGGSAVQTAMSAVAQKARDLNQAEADSDRAIVAELAAALKTGRLVQKP